MPLLCFFFIFCSHNNIVLYLLYLLNSTWPLKLRRKFCRLVNFWGNRVAAEGLPADTSLWCVGARHTDTLCILIFLLHTQQQCLWYTILIDLPNSFTAYGLPKKITLFGCPIQQRCVDDSCTQGWLYLWTLLGEGQRPPNSARSCEQGPKSV